MNKTKRALIITAIVLNFCSIALNLYIAITYFMVKPLNTYDIFLGVYELLGVIAYLVASGFLIYSIANKGIYFRQRNGYYMTAVTMTLILNLFSVSSVLLVITLFLSDWVWVRPQDDVYFTVEKEEKSETAERDRKIAELRKLKEEGKITEEEFNEQLFKLL